MEARADWAGSRARRIRSFDLAGVDADQFVVAWLPLCVDLRCWVDRWNARDVGIDRTTIRVHFQKTHSSPQQSSDTCRRVQHWLWDLVRGQLVLGVDQDAKITA